MPTTKTLTRKHFLELADGILRTAKTPGELRAIIASDLQFQFDAGRFATRVDVVRARTFTEKVRRMATREAASTSDVQRRIAMKDLARQSAEVMKDLKCPKP